MTDDNYFISNEEYIRLVKQAADEIEVLRAENKRLERENKKSRIALLRIQCIAQDITRPIPFQDEDDD